MITEAKIGQELYVVIEDAIEDLISVSVGLLRVEEIHILKDSSLVWHQEVSYGFNECYLTIDEAIEDVTRRAKLLKLSK